LNQINENIKDTIKINGSKTKQPHMEDIKNYGCTWLSGWGPSYCGSILSFYIKGVKEGMEKNKHEDDKFQKRCMDCLDDLLKTIYKKIY